MPRPECRSYIWLWPPMPAGTLAAISTAAAALSAIHPTPPTTITRRAALLSAATSSTFAFSSIGCAFAEDLDGQIATTVAKTPPSAADVALAYGEIVAASAALRILDNQLRYDEFQVAGSILSRRPLATFEANALTLIQSPAISDADTTYGTAAEAVSFLGAMRKSVRAEDSKEARKNGWKAKAAVDEIIALGAANGL